VLGDSRDLQLLGQMQPQFSRVTIRFCAGLLVLGALLAQSACGRVPFKVDVRQGNYITQETVALIVPGMPQAQVKSVLGAPLLVDNFHADRWDYIYLFTPGHGSQPIRRQLVVHFADGKVSRVVPGEMGVDPAEIPASAVPRLLDLDTPPAKR